MDDLSKSNHVSSAAAGRDVQDRRVEERFPFSAVTEVVDRSSGAHITARVSDISPTGCYLDLLNVLVPGTKVEIRIRHGSVLFEATGTVVYSMAGMGMGVAFDPVSSEMAAALKGWLGQVPGETHRAEDPREFSPITPSPPRVERHVLGRLIGIMTRKGILGTEEGQELLEDLLREN